MNKQNILLKDCLGNHRRNWLDLINQPKYGFPTIVLYIQCMIGHPSLGWTNCCVIHILYILQCDIIIHRAIQYVCLCVINSFAIKICCNIYSSTFGMNWYQCKIYPGVMCHIRAYTNVSRQDHEYTVLKYCRSNHWRHWLDLINIQTMVSMQTHTQSPIGLNEYLY